MDVLFLSRIQFALNSACHFIYPPISIGLGLMLVVMEGLYLKTKNPKYKEMTDFWIKIFALTFALGVATGIVQVFAFGTNWARYSRFVGDVFGSALAAEGVFAFFLESGFLGILLFGWNRVGPKIHYFSTIMVALGAHFSAIWILVANSWMQTPAGYRIDTSMGAPRAVVTNFWEMVFNPSAVDRICHVVLGCWLTGAFFVVSVGAYYMLRRRHEAVSRSMLKIGLCVAVGALALQLVSGDSSARIAAKYQPAKFAALEGIYQTVPSTPISVVGWVDTANQQVHSIQIPGMLSLMTYRNFSTPVPGLDQVPRDEWPNVGLVFQAYHLMIIMWALMALLALLACVQWRRGRLDQSRKLLWALICSVAFPHIALQTGWICTEVGRQPWTVYKLLRTADSVSTVIDRGQVIASLTMFTLVYALLFALFIFLLDRKIKHGPELHPVAGESVYRNPYATKE